MFLKDVSCYEKQTIVSFKCIFLLVCFNEENLQKIWTSGKLYFESKIFVCTNILVWTFPVRLTGSMTSMQFYLILDIMGILPDFTPFSCITIMNVKTYHLAGLVGERDLLSSTTGWAHKGLLISGIIITKLDQYSSLYHFLDIYCCLHTNNYTPGCLSIYSPVKSVQVHLCVRNTNIYFISFP